MNCLEDVTKALFQRFTNKCKDVKFVRSFPEKPTEFPVLAPTVAISIKNAEIPLSEGVFLGKTVENVNCYGVFASVTYSLTICVPKKRSGNATYETFDKIVNSILGLNSIYVTSARCYDIHYDRNMGALVLPAEIDVKAELLS